MSGHILHGMIALLLYLFALGPLAPLAAAQTFEVFASNNPPFNYTDADGTVQGIAVDILKELMKRVHEPVNQANMSVINWARAVEYTSTLPDKILLSPARNLKREALFSWVGPIHSFTLGLVARKDSNIRIDSSEDLRKYSIGVIRESAPVHILEKTFSISRMDMTQLANDDQLFLMLDRKRVDLVPRGRMSASYWLEKLQFNPDDYEMVYVLREMELYIAFSPMTDPDLIHRLNLELTRLKQGRPGAVNEYEAIIHKHVHGRPMSVRQH